MRALIVLLVMGHFAFADVDAESRALLIEKLQRVQMGLASNDPSKVSVTLRLADLYAERARQASMEEYNKGGADSQSAKADRQNALKLYQEVFESAPASQKGAILIQIGHLYQMQGDESKALQFYQKLGNSDNAVLRAEAQLSIAEVYFRKHQFDQAEPYYKTVLQTEGAASKGLAAYRLAWCAYNQGKVESARDQLFVMMKTPALLNRQGVSTGVADKHFKDEVSLDLSTFIARTSVQQSDLQSLYDLSSEQSRMQNLMAVASEAGRVGKKAESLLAWNFVEGKLEKPEARFNAWTNISGLNLDLGNKEKALSFFQKAVSLRSQIKTCEGLCKEADQRIRQILVSWNQIEKTAPSATLAEAYRIYEEQYKDDAEVHFWSANVHRDLKMWEPSWKASGAAQEAYVKTANKERLESILLYRLELAELAKNTDWLIEAQDQYITLSKNQSKIHEVRYQKAQTTYDAGKYAEASTMLREIALDTKTPLQLRKQAADLALDALVLLKDDSKMAVWSSDFAGAFTGEDRKDFVKIQQKAVLTESANLSAKNPAEAYALLIRFQMAEASPEDRITYLKNKIILGEKLGKFNEARAATDELLLQPKLTAEEHEFALGKKARFSELVLDFTTSLKALEKMKMEQVTTSDRLLKLALYAQLAGQSPDNYFRDYLRNSKPEEKQSAVAFELVKSSGEPLKEIEKQSKVLSTNPELLGEAYLHTYMRKQDSKVMKAALQNKTIKDTTAGKLFARMEMIERYQALKAKLEQHKLQQNNQKQLTASIKSRAALLEEADKFANQAIQSGDWTSQLLTLNLVGVQSDRFYQELLSLPIPAGLAPEEESQYLNILGQQAAPYQAKATQAKAKVEEFWKQTNWKESYDKAWQKEQYRALVKAEIDVLKEAAPADAATVLNSYNGGVQTAVVAEKTPAIQEIEKSRAKVRNEPFNVVALKELLQLEKQAKNSAMVQYLEGRIETTTSSQGSVL